ncbi:helix-turn-helix transcriptional regulator [Shewanella psychropiezotolerans]|uniref:Helix-turn-helix transcriptional regulator n=1 Tax=Shewanella psychropiezotolerans TaxID=2593655 RepID=A0ABX5WZI5_9GAMM|nr:AraC family transcriptional regulator [Shewanella psychropiezotolerans]QDO84241.1 helix-turn-helix transcriptional regulator [Shewanella psychropiezotolerans]
MSEIQIVLFRQAGNINYQGNTLAIASDQLVVTTGEARVSKADRGTRLNLFCYPGELHALYHEVVDLICPCDDTKPFNIIPIKVMPVFAELSNVIEQLNGNRSLLMKFIFIYCLGMENQYFSGLLRYFLAHNNKMLSYLEKNFMQPWSVTRFAEDLEIEVRKLNFFFYKNYGVSAKQWLLERRLSYARQQLLETGKKVIDIAVDSGFSSHSHFTESFKKRYLCSPKIMRSTLA